MGETIFAVSSGLGRAGVAVLRVSGPKAGDALIALSGRLPPPRRAALARLREGEGGETIDFGLILWFPGPASETGEDMAEFQVHGGPAVVAGVLGALGRMPGLRPAMAGEFARRAFQNGKLDLSEVEGLADLINAETEAQRRQALRQLDGGLSRLTENWRETLVAALAHVEATIDFADEDLGPGGDVRTLLDQSKHNILCLKDEITQYIDSSHVGERVRTGLAVAIVGAPNVGKSSLLNALAKRDAAIVAAQAGTTRDVIEVQLDLAGYPVILADTAGLRAVGESPDAQGAIEAEGIRRSQARAAAADLKLAVFDAQAAHAPDRTTADLVDGRTMVVLNKQDLASADLPDQVCSRPALAVSALTGAGLAALEAALAREAATHLNAGGEAPVFSRARHRHALSACAAALERAAAAPLPELAAEDLRLALRALGRIVGTVDVEDILDVVFRDFCIGK